MRFLQSRAIFAFSGFPKLQNYCEMYAHVGRIRNTAAQGDDGETVDLGVIFARCLNKDTDENGLLTQVNKMYVGSFDSANKYLLTDGDLLMARTGASAGNVLFFEGDEKAIFASYLIRLKFRKEVSSKLYWFFSKSKLYWDQVRHLSAGSAQPQFNGGALKKIIFPFPEALTEQKAIIKKLDAFSAETKKLEGIYKQKLADLEELKKSVLKKAFAGEL